MSDQNSHSPVEILFPDPSDFPGIHTSSLPDCLNCHRLKIENNVLRSDVGYWKSCYQRAVEREKLLKQTIEELEAKVKLRERQLFGRKTEKGSSDSEQNDTNSSIKIKRKRGQQRGAKGHGRRRHEKLPVVEEFAELSADQQICPCCGLPLEPIAGTQDSEVVEVEVRAYRRRIRRRRYKRTCNCPGLPRIITAPPAPKLIAKGSLGISFWVMILLGKFLFQRPLCRILTEFSVNHELNISQGTVTDGLQRLIPLFTPLYEEIVNRNISQGHWHADETTWLVFAEIEDKVGPRWYLWVFCTNDTVVFRIQPNRNSQVVTDHFGDKATGILSVDRYSAYKVMLKSGRILLAYCWAHVRRDFLAVAKDRADHEPWALDWVDRIGQLYDLNKKRLNLLDTPEVDTAQQNLQQAVDEMAACRDQQLSDTKLHSACRKVLESLQRHWSGLILFVDNPHVPMDNNRAERQLRNSVVGRKNYYGSGALWSTTLTAMLFSLFQTLGLWDINLRLWLEQYLLACAQNGASPPVNAKNFLPWNMTPEQLLQLRISKPIDTS
jgi:transposase